MIINTGTVFDKATNSWVCNADSLSVSNKKGVEQLADDVTNPIATKNPNTFYKNDHIVFNKPNQMRAMFKPVRVWFTPGGYTTVEWSDGTKTTAHAENEETANQYCGFCACVVKKLYGSTTKAMKMMQSADEKAKEPAKKRQEEKERRKKEKQYKVEHERILREARIQMHMRDIREKREAHRRIVEADERSEFGG